MAVYELLIVACWAIFLIVWLVSSIGTKGTISSYGRTAWLRIGVVIFIVILFNMPGLKTFAQLRPTDPIVLAVGVLFTVLGIAFAIWARVYLGKNWGMPMTIKEKPELITSGPYAYVRHPIYTGITLALIGTALATGSAAAVALVIFTAYFIYSAKQEEKQMLKEFPSTYPAYMRSTKMLIPFIF